MSVLGSGDMPEFCQFCAHCKGVLAMEREKYRDTEFAREQREMERIQREGEIQFAVEKAMGPAVVQVVRAELLKLYQSPPPSPARRKAARRKAAGKKPAKKRR